MKKEFGATKNGEKASCYVLKNSKGMEAVVSDFGASLLKLYVPDKDGKTQDVVLGYETLEDYENGGDSLGATVGRVANRIGMAEFELNGKKYELTKNDNGKNTLHGGIDFYNKRMWDVKEEDDTHVVFALVSPDGDQGFPGEVKIEVSYTITEENELKIHYQGICDEPTIANMTNHSYFNLNGEGSGTAMDQYLTIHAKYYTPVADSHSIPTGVYEEVAGTPMDFRTAKQIGQDIEAEFDQLKFTGGYDHNYVTDNYAKGNRRLIATAYSDKTGIAMDVTSDCPCVQFYAANFVENEHGKNGHTYNKRDAFCLETQVEPNAVNVEDFHSPILNAGEQYDSVTAYHFYIRK